MFLKEVSFPMVEGISPYKILFDKANLVKFVKLPMFVGIVPVKALPSSSRPSIDFNWSISEGMRPRIELSDSERTFNWVKFLSAHTPRKSLFFPQNSSYSRNSWYSHITACWVAFKSHENACHFKIASRLIFVRCKHACFIYKSWDGNVRSRT